MKQNKSHIVIIILFIAMITLPQIVFWITKDETVEVSTTENRKLNEKPELELATITEYPKKFDNYYNDHLPFRTELRNMWTSLNYDLFKVAVDEQVVIGKDEWLFFDDKSERAMGQIQGIVKFKEEQKQKILKNLEENQEVLKNKGIDFFVLIPPNKENVYREYLPDTIKIKENTTRTEELIEYIREKSDIKIVYPKDELIKQKDKHQVYMKYDTHWNKLGALIGTIELQKVIANTQCFDIEKANVVRTNEKEDNDLSVMINLENKLYENKIEVNNFYSDIKCTHTKKDKYEIFESNSKNDKTVLVIGDSYRLNTRPYLSKLYKKTCFVYTYDYNEKMLEEIKPDIVIYETLERYSNRLAYIKINSEM